MKFLDLSDQLKINLKIKSKIKEVFNKQKCNIYQFPNYRVSEEKEVVVPKIIYQVKLS
jgi:hypothetical protein